MLQASLRTKMERAPLSADRSTLFQSSRTTTCQAGGPHNKSVGGCTVPHFHADPVRLRQQTDAQHNRTHGASQ